MIEKRFRRRLCPAAREQRSKPSSTTLDNDNIYIRNMTYRFFVSRETTSSIFVQDGFFKYYCSTVFVGVRRIP